MWRLLRVLILLACACPAALSAGPSLPLREEFELQRPAEVVAAIGTRCAACDWGRPGREGVSLRLALDGRYARHLVLARGGEAVSRVGLGALAAGRHRLEIDLDAGASAAEAGPVEVTVVAIEAVERGDARHPLLAHAPILHARPNAIGRFSDVPLLVWVEQEPLPGGRRRLRYSAVFSNEDGGTPPDRLLATWGRLTDLEYLYGVELAADGRVLRAEFQGEGHVIQPFEGEREGDHPLLFVVTDNNMLAGSGESGVRYAPAPAPFDLSGASREAVMDSEPWTYRVSSLEVRREGRVAAAARPGDGRIADPRRYLYLEACAETRDVGLTFGAGLAAEQGPRFVDSDGGLGELLVLRSPDHFPNGCFRSAVALPEGARPEDVLALRFRAHTRPPREGEDPLPPGSGSARLLRVTKLFGLGPDHLPEPSLFSWEGELPLAPGGEPAELRVRP